MKKTAKPITKEEAVSILASALSYCQQAGLPVIAHHEASALVLTLPGLTVAIQDGQAVFGLAGDDTPPGSDGTSSKFVKESAGTIGLTASHPAHHGGGLRSHDGQR